MVMATMAAVVTTPAYYEDTVKQEKSIIISLFVGSGV